MAKMVLQNHMPISSLRSDDVQNRVDEAVWKIIRNKHFISDEGVWDILGHNPDIKSYKLLVGNSPDSLIPGRDPLYGGRDVGLKFTFVDGRGAILIFDLVEKSFFHGHGAKVMHFVGGYSIAYSGKLKNIENSDEAGRLAMLIFVRQPHMLFDQYNKMF